MKKTDKPIRQAVWQVPLLMIMACLVALLTNHWRGAPLPLIGDWSVKARFTDNNGENLVIPLDEAKLLFQRNAAKFVDARSQSQYMDGHISGALSLPFQDATNAFTDVAAELKNKDIIITYCDGETCELSHDLALFLKDMGFGNVRTLVNGWTVWQETGLPTEKAGGSNEVY
jgi:rhodanese-related sulfurtransferase